MLGEAFLLLTNLLWAIALILERKLTGRVDLFFLSLWIVTIGVLIFSPAITRLNIQVVKDNLALMIAAGFLQSVGLIFYLNGVKLVTASRASIFALTFPIFVGILAVVFLGEQITTKLIASFVLISAGVAVLLI